MLSVRTVVGRCRCPGGRTLKSGRMDRGGSLAMNAELFSRQTSSQMRPTGNDTPAGQTREAGT